VTKPRRFEHNPVLRVGYALSAFGVLALSSLFLYNHGLEDTLAFILYMITAVAIPLGLMLCIIGIAFNRLWRTRHRP
jgi:uncharacterized membrane protein